jgi:hypothetical protein
MNHENIKIGTIFLVALSTLVVGVLVHYGSNELVSSIRSVNAEINDLKLVLNFQLQSIRNDVQNLQRAINALINSSSTLISLP